MPVLNASHCTVFRIGSVTLILARRMHSIFANATVTFCGGGGGGGLYELGGGSILGIPTPFVLFAALSVVMWVLLDRTIFGRRLYAIGGNEQAARLSGIDTVKWRILVYMLSGTLAALGGMIVMVRSNSVQPTIGSIRNDGL